jgi:hypothetical protein
MTDLIKAFGGSLPQGFDPATLLEAAARLPQTGDKPYMMFRDGEWSFGVDHAEVDEDDLWAINPNSYQFGLIEWCEGQAGGEILVPAGMEYSVAEVPRKFQDEPEARISPQVAVDMMCVAGNYRGQQVNYKTSTRGGTSVLNNLANDIARQYKNDDESIVPVVKLESDSYIHKKFNRKTYVPVLSLQFWDNLQFKKAQKKYGSFGDEPKDLLEDEPKQVTRQRGRRVRSN